MPSPPKEDIQRSLAQLKTGEALAKKDFFNVIWGFAFHPEQDRFLLEVNAANPKLAESLLIFRKMLRNTPEHEQNLEASCADIFHHYIINTKGVILEKETDDPFDVFQAATAYAKGLSVLVDEVDGSSILELDGKKIKCPNWSIVKGWSAAWSLRQVGPVINRVRYGRDDVIPSRLFDFDQESDWHHLPNAMILADFAHLAYFGPAYIEQQLQQWGYDSFQWIEDLGTDTQAYVAAKEQHVIVCYRGTASRTDWIMDAKLSKTASFNGVGKVHRGFKSALDSVWEKIKTAVEERSEGRKLFVTGHSLGAALAQLTAYRLAVLQKHDIAAVYAFGSPRIGNRAYKKAYDELLSFKTFLHINNQDIVPQLPPRILGYRHVGPTPRRFDRGHQLSEPSPFERALPDIEEEKEFEELDPQMQKRINLQMAKMRNALASSTQFLDTPPEFLQTGDYETAFELGLVDDHSMHQYLFKLGCAIVDGEWKRLEK